MFLVDLWMHNASYACGFIGGLVLIAKVWRERRLAAVSPADQVIRPSDEWVGQHNGALRHKA